MHVWGDGKQGWRKLEKGKVPLKAISHQMGPADDEADKFWYKQNIGTLKGIIEWKKLL
jgi:hypothetical protein